MNIDQLLRKLDDLPPAPQILPKLMGLLNDPNSDADDLVNTIKLDLTLTSKVLKLSNSAYFASSVPCGDLDEAINRIGFREIYRMVSLVCAAPVLQRDMEMYYLQKDEMWESAVGCALICEHLASVLRMNESSAYTLGLLHGIGKVALNHLPGEGYDKVYALIEQHGFSFTRAEREVFGFDHAVVGAAILEKWKFPAPMVQAVQSQYDPQLATDDSKMEACLLHVSHWISTVLGLTHGRDGLAIDFKEESLPVLGITPLALEKETLKAHEKLDSLKDLLKAS